MTSQNLNPTRIEWQRDGYTIRADEDGVHINVQPRAFEMPEALVMVELYQEIVAHYRTGEPFPKPVPPTREQRTYYPSGYTARRVQRVVSAAITAELDPSDSDAVAPF